MTLHAEHDLNLAVIGNCTIASLIDRNARIVFGCFPRLDGDPIFNALLNATPDDATPDSDETGGFAAIEVEDFSHAEQAYRRNSAVLVTTLHDTRGQSVEVIDFAPRFPQFDRMHRPSTIVRIIRPAKGHARICLRYRPTFGYNAIKPEMTRGSNHIRYVDSGLSKRLTTDAPISYIVEETAFMLEEPIHIFFGPDESLTAPIGRTAEDFLEKTDMYWREFSRGLTIPFEWQDAVIRAAITLKLCSFEETGAILAAITTSIPEAPHSERNWDYRFCWLRDSYFVVHALNRLGATRTMERYLHYINNVVTSSKDGYLDPLFSITLSKKGMEETSAPALAGYRGMGPVRTGNQAATQVQNDSYGAVILAAAQAFFDQRVEQPGTIQLFQRLKVLGEQAVKVWNTPDAGLWELRTRERVHTFSAVMCWAACDRLSKIGNKLGLPQESQRWRREADAIREVIMEKAFDKEQNSFVESFGGKNIDAALLLLHELGFVAADDPKYLGTVAAAETYLKKGMHLYRYHAPDDFGEPETAFTICSFWYVDALAAIGRREEAREMFEALLAARNPLGLLSEDIDPKTNELWGNFPQSYSMVGLINSAMKLSKSWEEAF